MANTTIIEKITDICSTKHGGNEQSRAAHRRGRNSREQQRMKVLELIKNSHNGLSMKEVATILDCPFNACSGRASELKKFGLIEKTGEVREGSAVLKATSRVFAPIVIATPPPPTTVKEPIKAMSPTAVQRELEKLEYLYENTPLSDANYERAKAKIMAAFEAWSNEGEV